MTEFAGWLMPLRYGSETAEHLAVRSSAGLFDLSHMGEIAVTGPGAGEALDYALTGWLSRLAVGQARYTMLCAPDGGVLDDLVIYRQSPDRFLVVANAANTAVVLGELQRRSAGAVVQDETEVTGLIAIQGPNAPGILSRVTDLPLEGMRYYRMMRKRMALDLADAVVTNRFLLWGFSGLTSLAWISVSAFFLAIGANLGTDPIPVTVTSAGGILNTVLMVLIFMPPAAYVRWVERSARSGALATV